MRRFWSAGITDKSGGVLGWRRGIARTEKGGNFLFTFRVLLWYTFNC